MRICTVRLGTLSIIACLIACLGIVLLQAESVSAQAQRAALAGQVSSAAEPSMEGVLVKAAIAKVADQLK